MSTVSRDQVPEHIRKQYVTADQVPAHIKGKAGMSHKAPSQEAQDIESISKTLGYENVDWKQEMPFGTRADLGLSSDVNRLKKLQSKYPDYMFQKHGNRIMAKPPGKKWHPVDAPGFTSGDVADLSGEALPILGSLGAVAAAPATMGIMGLAGLGGLGAAAGRLATDALEAYRGYNKPTGEMIGDALMEGAIDTGFGLGGGMVGKLASGAMGRGFAPPHSSLRRDLGAIYRMNEAGKLPMPMVKQVTQPGQIAHRIGKQAASMSSESSNLSADQAEAVAKYLRTMPGDSSAYSLGKQLQAEAAAGGRRELRNIMRRFDKMNPENAGFATKKAQENWLKTANRQINARYSAVGAAADAEKPLFDLTPAKEKFKEIGVLGAKKPEEAGIGILDAQGDELTKQIWPLINVAETPSGKLRRVGEILDQLDSTQTNWKVIKELRSSVGRIIKDTPWNVPVDLGPAKQMYRTLTETLENPSHVMVNGVYTRGGEGAYSQAIKAASAESARKFDVLTKSRVRHIIQTDDINDLGTMFGKPGAMTPEVRSVLASQPDQLRDIGLFAQRQIALDEGGAVNAIQRWVKDDPQGFQLLFGKNTKELNDTAQAIDVFNATPLAKISHANNKPLGTVRNLLLSPDTSRADVQKLITAMGGKGSRGHELLRAAILEDISAKSLKPAKRSGWTVDKDAMHAAAGAYRKNGAWNEVLTQADRANIDGIEAYVRVVLGDKADVGTSLEAAAAISDLKHPGTFIRGIREIGVNKVLADIMMKPSVVKALSGTGKQAFSNKPFVAAGIIAESFKDSVFADPAVQEYLYSK